MAQRQRKGSPAQKQGGGNGMFYAVLVVVAVVGLAALGYALTGRGGSAATEPIQLDASDVRTLYEQATPVRVGNDDAPIKIVEFADFMCPACRDFSLEVRPKLMPYIQSGEAQLVFYDFPLGGAHVHSFLASRAARCGGDQQVNGEDGYWPMHEKLFQEQPTWSAQRDVVDTFVGYAKDVGLNEREFEKCLKSDKYADVVTANRMVGDELGVNSTPTVLVNNRQVGGRTVGDMERNLLQVLQSSAASPQPAGQGSATAPESAAAPESATAPESAGSR